jgi:hypothetical protein
MSLGFVCITTNRTFTLSMSRMSSFIEFQIYLVIYYRGDAYFDKIGPKGSLN